MLSVSCPLYLGLGLFVVPWSVWWLCPSLCGAFAEPVVCCSYHLFPFLRSPSTVPGTHEVEVGGAVAVFNEAALLYTLATALPWLDLVLKALKEEWYAT